LFIAVREGSISSIAIILDLRGDINAPVYFKRLDERLTPLEYAIYIEEFRSVRRLLSRGATISPVSQWLADDWEVYHELRKEKLYRDGVLAIEYDKFVILSEEARAAL
jgi:hypothetical protein